MHTQENRPINPKPSVQGARLLKGIYFSYGRLCATPTALVLVIRKQLIEVRGH